MKVNIAFAFTDAQLRAIRAAHGRGGTATRAECRVFIDRAVTTALQAAPEPKPKRRPAAPPPAAPPAICDRCYGHLDVCGHGTATDEDTRARARRDAIRRTYKV